jgi:Holliday junction resolvasome RuvABC endonuclease subunit
MKIVAFDLSLTATGWAQSLDDVCSVGVISTPDRPKIERLGAIRRAVLDKADGADVVILEDYAFSQVNRAHAMGELGGVIRLALHDERLPYATVAPTSLKKYAAGKGNAKKEAVLAAAIRRLDYQGDDHNEADALWLLAMALDHYAIVPVNVPQAHRAALDKVNWPTVGHYSKGE